MIYYRRIVNLHLINWYQIIVKEHNLKEFDIFTHQIPLLIMIYLYFKYVRPKNEKLNLNLIVTFLILYITQIDIKKVYNLNYTPLLISLLLTLILFKFIL